MLTVRLFDQNEWKISAFMERGSDGFCLAYAPDYVKSQYHLQLNNQLHRRLPLSLFEVFGNEQLTSFLSRYAIDNLTEVSPNQDFGNIIISGQQHLEVEENCQQGRLFETLYDTDGRGVIGDLPWLKRVRYTVGNQSCLFAALSGTQAFPTMAIFDDNVDSTAAVMLPDLPPRWILDECADYPINKLMASISYLTAQFNGALGCETRQIEKIGLLREDIQAQNLGKPVCLPVLNLAQVGLEEYVNDEQFIRQIIMYVSANKHNLYFPDRGQYFIQEILKRHVLCRLLLLPFSVQQINLVRRDQTWHFMAQPPIINWHADAALFQPDEPIDYPWLCHQLESVCDPRGLLFELSEFAEGLIAIGESYRASAYYNKKIESAMRIGLFHQHLERWGLLI